MKVKDIGKRITALLTCCLVGGAAAVAANYFGDKTRSSFDISTVTSEELLRLCQDEEFLSGIAGTEIDGTWFSSEKMRIRTNENGDTYGSGLFTDAARLDVDLISAVGKNGVEGYIWRSSLPLYDPNYVPKELPVYESDGVTVVDWMSAPPGSSNANAIENALPVFDSSTVTSEELLRLCQDDEFLSGISGTIIDKIWFSSEDMKIRTNENGNTYGGAFFVKRAHLDVDLVGARGRTGVEGYVWRSTLPWGDNENYLPSNENPVYASDGVTFLDYMP